MKKQKELEKTEKLLLEKLNRADECKSNFLKKIVFKTLKKNSKNRQFVMSLMPQLDIQKNTKKIRTFFNAFKNLCQRKTKLKNFIIEKYRKALKKVIKS